MTDSAGLSFLPDHERVAAGGTVQRVYVLGVYLTPGVPYWFIVVGDSYSRPASVEQGRSLGSLSDVDYVDGRALGGGSLL